MDISWTGPCTHGQLHGHFMDISWTFLGQNIYNKMNEYCKRELNPTIIILLAVRVERKYRKRELLTDFDLVDGESDWLIDQYKKKKKKNLVSK